MVLEDYYYHEALNLGLFQDKKFLLDKQNYKNKIMLMTFENEVIRDNIIISEKDIERFYENNKEQSTKSTHAIISILIFENEEIAVNAFNNINNLHLLPQNQLFDTSSIEGIKDYQPLLKISYNENPFSESVSNTISNTENNRALYPIYINNQYYIIYKHNELGTSIQTFEEVEDVIIYRLKEESFNNKRQNFISDLKKKFKVQNNIDYKQYLH